MGQSVMPQLVRGDRLGLEQRVYSGSIVFQLCVTSGHIDQEPRSPFGEYRRQPVEPHPRDMAKGSLRVTQLDRNNHPVDGHVARAKDSCEVGTVLPQLGRAHLGCLQGGVRLSAVPSPRRCGCSTEQGST